MLVNKNNFATAGNHLSGNPSQNDKCEMGNLLLYSIQEQRCTCIADLYAERLALSKRKSSQLSKLPLYTIFEHWIIPCTAMI